MLVKFVSKHGKPQKIVIDKLASSKVAPKDLKISHLQNIDQYSNNQIENSHLHFHGEKR